MTRAKCGNTVHRLEVMSLAYLAVALADGRIINVWGFFYEGKIFYLCKGEGRKGEIPSLYQKKMKNSQMDKDSTDCT